MRKLILVSLVAVSAVACKSASSGADGGATTETPSLAQKALSFLGGAVFEGEVTSDVSGKMMPKTSIVYRFKGDKLRYDLPAGAGVGGGWVLVDTTSHKTYMINDTQKMVMTIDPDAKPAAAPTPADEPKITKTGKHETIAGYDCEDWTVEQKGKKSEACVTDGLSFAFGSPRDAAGDWTQKLVAAKQFPLKMVRYDASGAEEMRMEVTKVERKALDGSQFEVPAGYHEMDLGGLLGGMATAAGSAAPPGSFQLPPGIKLPPGVKLPPGMGQPPPK